MKTIIVVPCMDTVQTEFCQSLAKLQRVGSVEHEFTSCSLVYKARNDLGRMAAKGDSDFVLWLDSDVIFPTSLLADMIADMGGRDILTGVYHMRRPPFLPVIWKTLTQGLTPEENVSEVAIEYPADEIFEVDACGFGCVLMRTEVLRVVLDKYHDLFSPLPGYGEDLSFCIRARGCGYTIHCDPRIQIGHKAGTIVTKDTFEAYRQKVGGDLL